MSVLKVNRSTSKTEFVNTAMDLVDASLSFVTRLSNRYSRLLAPAVMEAAFKLSIFVEIANSIFPNTEERLETRKKYLLLARGYTKALDVIMLHCYRIACMNPQGCFTDSRGNTIDSTKARDRLDKMADTVGDLIDREIALLTGTLDKSKVVNSKFKKNKSEDEVKNRQSGGNKRGKRRKKNGDDFVIPSGVVLDDGSDTFDSSCIILSNEFSQSKDVLNNLASALEGLSGSDDFENFEDSFNF